MNFEHLQALREHELKRIVPLMLPGSSILEIGAGSGWQAKALAEQGFQVEAIDIAGTFYAAHRVWPVSEYDGNHIPFPDNHFDIVFSSNVLEHIAHVEAFQSEIRRVLKPEGIAMHVLPTGSWCFWTILTYFPCQLGKVLSPLLSRLNSDLSIINGIKIALYRLYKHRSEILVPPRHGERGNVLTEIYLFSRFAWTPLFRYTGWKVRAYHPNRLFYTGQSLFNSGLSIRTRTRISRILGSACAIYVLEPSA